MATPGETGMPRFISMRVRKPEYQIRGHGLNTDGTRTGICVKSVFHLWLIVLGFRIQTSGRSSADGAVRIFVNGSIAAAASGPETSRVSSVPDSAAKSISSKGLLPLIRLSSLQRVTELSYRPAV